MTGIQGLVRHLKENPASRDVAALSHTFGVEHRLVKIAISNLESRPAPRTTGPNKLDQFFSGVLALWDRATARMWLYLLATSFLTPLVVTALNAVPSSFKTANPLEFGVAYFVGAFVLVPVVHGLALLLKGSWRDSLVSVAVWPVLVVVAMLAPSGKGGQQPALYVLLWVVIVLCYSLYAFPLAVFGSFLRVKKEAKAAKNLTRQQMLERLIEIRSVLSTQPEAPRKARKRTLGDRLSRHIELTAFFTAALLGFASGQVLVSMDPDRSLVTAPQTRNALPPGVSAGELVLMAALSVFSYLQSFGAGFLSRSFARCVLTVLAVALGHFTVLFVPGQYMSLSMLEEVGPGKLLAGNIVYGILVVLGWMSFSVIDHARTQSRTRANDPDTLMEEMLDLEWRLTPTSSRVAVMAVDVAGSTAMKRGADPLIAEWSFREYQEWVARVCARFGGKVHSTAGDGAILGFEDPQDAFDAACAVQREVASFNAERNRLGDAFKLRIGLHVGDVQGDLGDVQFTRVIDVAAHIESRAPIGGLAASEEFAQLVPPGLFSPSATVTDGHNVLHHVPAESPVPPVRAQPFGGPTDKNQ